MGWWEMRARVAGQAKANRPDSETAAGRGAPSDEEFEAALARFADL